MGWGKGTLSSIAAGDLKKKKKLAHLSPAEKRVPFVKITSIGVPDKG
jgi:hypothetical protein